MFRFRSIICLLILSTVSFAEEKTGTLYWANGDSLPGELLETNGNQLRWKSSLFREPLLLDTRALSAVRFDHSNEVVVTDEAFRLITRSGNVLHGALSDITEKLVELRSTRHSTIYVDRTQIRSLRRLDNPSLIYLGPTGLNGWKTLSSKRKVDDWQRTDEGYLKTRRDKAQLFRRLDIPGRAEIEVALATTGQMQFHLGLSDNAEDDVHLETWDDTLVALVDEEFVEIQQIPKGLKQLTLRIYWDQKNQTLSVYSEAGAELGSITGTSRNPGKPGVFIENHGPGLTVKSIRVSHWDGSKPKPVQKGQNRIHLIDGKLLYGTVQSLEGQIITVQKEDDDEETRIPMDQIDSIYLADDEKTIADGSTNVFWLDGSRITGELTEIKDGNIGIKTNYSSDPIISKLKKSNRLQFNPGEKVAGGQAKDGEDMLYCSGGKLRGTLVGNGNDTGEAALRWRPVGGLNSSPLAPNCDARFVRGKRTKEITYDKKKFGDLLYLVSGDIVPCHVDSITEEALHIETAFAKGRKIPHDNVKAIELSNADALTSTGFDARGWDKGSGKDVKFDGNKVTFKSAGRVTHKNVFAGGTASFSMKWPSNSYVTATLRLFQSSGAGGCTLQLTGQNNRLYVSESTNGRGRMLNASVSNNDAKVQLVLKDEKLQVLVNKRLILTTNKLKRRRGAGLTLQVSQNRFFNGRNNNANAEVVFSKLVATRGTAVRSYVDSEAKERALIVPRFRRDKPSTHVLIAPNGDLLRGKLRMVTPEQVRFSSRLEDFRFERKRVAAIIWLHPDGTKDQPEPEQDAPVVRAVLDGGLGLVLVPNRMTEDQLMGESPVLGECAVPVSAIRELFAGKYEKKGETFAYADWAITPGMEPRWDMEDTGGGDPAMQLIGQKAGDFKLPTLAGKEPFQLSKLAAKDGEGGKIVVLDFWATWCGPCVKAMPEYLAAIKELPADEVEFIAVNQGEAKEVINGFLERRKEWEIKTVALDEDMQVAQAFQVSGIPHTVVIGKDGTIEWVHTGFKPGVGEELKANIQKMIDETWERPNLAADGISGTDSKLVGTDAADFTMAVLGSKKEFSLKASRGKKVVILDFWATWCGPCVRALPEYEKMMEELDSKDVQFFAINEEEREDLVKKFMETRKVKLPVGFDPEGKIAKLFEVESLPQTVVIDKNGKIRWLHVGYKTGVTDALKKTVQELLAEEETKDAAPAE